MPPSSTQKPWLLMTGSSRGIGKALHERLADRYRFIEVGRIPTQIEETHIKINWDLSKPLDELTRVTLNDCLQNTGLNGILHCAGVLGPWGGPESLAHSPTTYWPEHMAAYRINVCVAFDLVAVALPYLKSFSTATPPPFVMHLSSGAAVKPYVGWETYSTTKAACLMAFKTLAARYKPTELLCLSIAPGTVMTDMMKKVLAADKQKFPNVEKFLKLQSEGKLVSPTVPAAAIDKLLHGDVCKLINQHGELYDVRDHS